MLENLKRQFAVQWETAAAGCAVMLGAWLTGVVIHAVIQGMREPPDEVVALGTCIACVAAAVYLLFVMIGQISLYFRVEVGMGLTRRNFCLTHFVFCLTEALGYTAVLILLCAAEDKMNGLLYPGKDSLADLVPYLCRWAFPGAAALGALGNLAGALLMRFGRRIAVVLWAVWMLLCIGVPRIFEAAEKTPESPAGRVWAGIIRAASGIPRYLWLLLLAAVSLACFAACWTLLRRHPVDVC